MKGKIITAAVIIAIILIAGFLYTRYRVAPEMDFASLQLTDLDNVPVKPEIFNGKKLYVKFFATWCGPCVREFPIDEGAQAMLQNKNVLFVCISDEPVERLRAFKERMHLDMLILHSLKNFHDINIYTFPTTYFANEKGKIVFKKTNELDWNANELAKELTTRTE